MNSNLKRTQNIAINQEEEEEENKEKDQYGELRQPRNLGSLLHQLKIQVVFLNFITSIVTSGC